MAIGAGLAGGPKWPGPAVDNIFVRGHYGIGHRSNLMELALGRFLPRNGLAPR